VSLLTDHRTNVDNATTLAIADTISALELLKDRPVPELAWQLKQTLPAIASMYATVSEQVAVDFYEKSRQAAGITSTFDVTPANFDPLPALDSSIGYGISRTILGTDYATFSSILAGSMQRVVSNADRQTISWNIASDPDGTMYERVPSSNGCAFCLMLAAVAKLRTSDYFTRYHDYCRCTTVPVFVGQAPHEQPIYDQIRSHYSDAVSEIQVKRELVGYNKMKSREAAKKHPDLTLTTPNILKIVRQTTGLK
jgi:hypothetical protein